MGSRGGVVAVLSLVGWLASTSFSVVDAADEAVEAAGICARCHDQQTASAVNTSSHAAVTPCVECHPIRRRGRFGRRHRYIPKCTSHHDQEAHPPAAKRRGTRNCIVCHEPHGSTNRALVRERIRARRRRRVPVEFTNQSGAAPGGFTDAAAPGKGICEICHRRTRHYRRNGGGEPHTGGSCVVCHDHTAGFLAVPGSERNCPACHTDNGARFEKDSLHSAMFECADCHEELLPAPGPGHRRKPECNECHTSQTHAPPGRDPSACTRCHNPHGTDNIRLIREVIAPPPSPAEPMPEEKPIQFDNLMGKADGSFASASSPGSGICEICHTTTRYYRADATGDPHFEFSCVACHLHEAGFIFGQ